MCTWRASVGFALVAASAACGELASRGYQPPPIAVIRGELALPATAFDGEAVRMLLVWQPAAGTSEPADVFLETNPQVAGLPLSCGAHGEACGWTGDRTCTVRRGIAEHIATLSIPASGMVEFEAPIYSLPPAAALRDVEGTGRVAFGYLLILPGRGDVGGPPVSPVASSAFNGKLRSFSSPYRTSFLIAYLEGTASAPASGSGGDLASPVSETCGGLLRRLPLGFSLVLKLEKADANGRLLPVHLASAPLETLVSLNGLDAGEGGTWCAETVVHERWGPFPAQETWDRCSSTTGALACTRQERDSPCDLEVALHETCMVAPTVPCVPGPSIADPLAFGSIPHRDFHRLRSGAILAMGGLDPSTWSQVSLYDPAARKWWQPTAAPTFRRRGAPISGLPSGRALVTGAAETEDASRTVEMFDPATGVWTRALSMRTPRTGHTATLLSSNRVLVVGGLMDSQPQAIVLEAEVYDPADGTWIPFDFGLPGLVGHSTLSLPGEDGGLFVTGSNGGPATWLCSVEDGGAGASCEVAGAMHLAHPDGTFTVLPSGKVLALGGRIDPTSAETFDPVSMQWTPVAPMPNGRSHHAAVVLPRSGLVVAAGGEAATGAARVEVDVYDPGTDRWRPSWPLEHPRSAFAMFATDSDEVLVVGGPMIAIYAPPVERLCVGAP